MRWIARMHLKIFYNNLIKIGSLPDSQWNWDQIPKNSESKASRNSESINFLLRIHVKLYKKGGWSLGLKHLHKTIREERESLMWCLTLARGDVQRASTPWRRWDAQGGTPKRKGDAHSSFTPPLSLSLSLFCTQSNSYAMIVRGPSYL